MRFYTRHLYRFILRTQTAFRLLISAISGAIARLRSI